MPEVETEVVTPGVEHNGQHRNCPPCYKIKLQTVQFGASTTPFLRSEAVKTTQQETKLSKDLAAYKSLVQSGIQPASTRDAADLASANTQFEIESGKIVGEKMSKKIQGIIDELPKGVQTRNPADF